MQLIFRMMRYLRPYRRQAISSYAALIIAILLQLAVPLLVRQIINSAISVGDRRFLTLAALGIVVVTLAQSTFMYTRSYWLQYLAERVAYDVRNEMYQHLENLSFSYLRHRADRPTALPRDRGCQQHPPLLHVRLADGGAIRCCC